MHLKPFTLSLISASMLLTNIAMAEALQPAFISKTTQPASIQAYWTKERMQSATPMDLPTANPNKVVKISTEEMRSHFQGTPEGRDGYEPPVEPIPNMEQIFVPKITASTQKNLDAGTLNQLFTSA
ncbi:MAG TPA: hypothetical protein VHM20_06195, partial [Gammaproteobacteria bacterium]|nr:hypothetical protein [Gammaproteobacteria bacterium]